MGGVFGLPTRSNSVSKKRSGAQKAMVIAGMVAGSATVIVWKNISMLSDFVYELVPGFIVSFLVIVIVSLLTEAPAVPSEVTGSGRVDSP